MQGYTADLIKEIILLTISYSNYFCVIVDINNKHFFSQCTEKKYPKNYKYLFAMSTND